MAPPPPAVVESAEGVTVTITSPLTHLCPHVDEVDRGTVEITWACHGWTYELHSLADYLAGFADEHVSHEALARQIAWDLTNATDGVSDVAVRATFTTAGLTAQVTSCSTSPTPAPAQSVTPWPTE